MNDLEIAEALIGRNDVVLVTGATGFVGVKVVERLLDLGFARVRCFVRPASQVNQLGAMAGRATNGARVELLAGNLLSRSDCAEAMKDVALVFHLATSRDGKSYPEAFMNSVVTTRNLLEAAHGQHCLKRFVSISSFAVYTNAGKPAGRLLDESCPVETHPELRGDAYSFAKVKQDEMVIDYGARIGIPYVIVRPGYVLGPDKPGISSRVGIDTFGLFLHLGGSNTMPFTYVDNCADAIVRAGLTRGVEGEVFNVVDDDLPSSRQFLRMYKRKVKNFKSLYIPHAVSYALCGLWEWYSRWSEGQLPPTFNRLSWHVNWKKTEYSNVKLKRRLGWAPRVPMKEALDRCFRGYKDAEEHA